MSKSMMQKIYEWSMRNTGETKTEPDPIDIERILWLKEAWENSFVDGATLMRNILRLVGDAGVPVEDKAQLLEELSDLLENVDNAGCFQQLGGWAKLTETFGQALSVEVNQQILFCFAHGLLNAPKVQEEVLSNPAFADVVLRPTLAELRPEFQKQMLAILGAFYQNQAIAFRIHELLQGASFVAEYRRRGYDAQPRFEHLVEVFSNSREDDQAYNQLLKKLLE